MSKTDGITRSRRKVETYKGFSIIKVLSVHHWFNNYNKRYEMSSQYETKREISYEFCKEGEDNRPSQAYEVNAKSIAECKECIDNFLKDDTLYFTPAEYDKYVKNPNHKCGWAYGYNSLMKVMREHQKASKRIKILLEDRLTDANFHSACGYLCKGDYDGFEKFVAEDCQFSEKFEIKTETKRRRMQDPKQFEEGLAEVIANYFKQQGVKDTSVRVKFIEDW